MLYYSLLQLALWWIFHIALLLWKIQFHFHARSFKVNHQIKYIHIAMIVTALTVPVAPVLATVTNGGYALPRFPPILCMGRSPNTAFYSLVLPIIVLMQCGITMLIYIFWNIHKVHQWEDDRFIIQPIHSKISSPPPFSSTSPIYYTYIII